jgi:hypothetical protein
MGQRFGAFFATVLGGGLELFGALGGQGVLGHGMLFGLLGPETRTEAVIVGIVMAAVTLVCGVLLMFVRDTRPLAAIIAVAGIVGTLAAGALFGLGALIALVGVVLAVRLDRSAPLT